jgi:hypothetical protein
VSASNYLTRSELRELCGRKTKAAIAAWLKAAKIKFVPDADGWPKVARGVHDQRLGLAEESAPAHHPEPDFAAIARRPRAAPA